MRISAPSVIVVFLLLAGCLAGEPNGPPESAFAADWSELALASGDGHDHADPLQHADLTTPNFEVVGHDRLISDYYGATAGGYICGDAQPVADGRVIAAVESRSDVGFALVDVTDPAQPRWLGELVMRNTYVYDLAVVPGGQHVVLVTRHATVDGLGNVPPLAAAPSMTWETPCAPPRDVVDRSMRPEDPVPRPLSIVLVDIRDPASPVIVDQQPLYGFGHSVFATQQDGRTLLLVTTLGPAPAADGISGFELYEVAATPLGARLALLSTYRPAAADATLPANLLTGRGGHDGWIAKHPVTGDTYAYLVGADLFTILDISDPRLPEPVGTWSEAGPGRAGYSGVLHSVVPLLDLWNGRHYTIVGPEWGNHPVDHPSGIVWVLDTTDPTAPFEVAGWTLPHEVEWNGTYMFSNHYYGVVGKTLFVSMYHGGIWAVDLAPVLDAVPTGFVLLPSVGVFVPIDPDAEPAVIVRWTPNSQEVLPLADGTMVTFDSSTGVWAFRFDEGRPAPASEPWPVAPVG